MTGQGVGHPEESRLHDRSNGAQSVRSSRRSLLWYAAGAPLSLAACSSAQQMSQPLSVALAADESQDTPPEPTVEPTPTSAPPPPTPTPVPAPPKVPVFYRSEYAMASHTFETTRKAMWVAESLQSAPLEQLELQNPELLSPEQVLGVHGATYVNAVRTGHPRSLAESQGFVWDPGLWTMVLASNGGVVAAALEALETGVAGSLSSGLHHAHRDKGSGYCTFNGLAMAAGAAVASGARRVLIVDLDAHCGGGTHELIAGNSAVHHLDVAVHWFDQYTPRGGNTLDLVPAANRYLPTIRRRLDALDGSSFDLCLYNAGMDPYEGCPIGGMPGITRGVLTEREQLIFDWCRDHDVPIAFTLAGGYLGPTVNRSRLTDLHRLTLTAAAQMPVRTSTV